MGVFSAFKRSQDGAGRAETVGAPHHASRYDPNRDSTLEDGLGHIIDTIDSLAELDARLRGLEQDLIGESPISLSDLPGGRDDSREGVVPRLMEAALLIGALSRRMHLRLGVIEGALGVRAKPVGAFEDALADDDEVEDADYEPFETASMEDFAAALDEPETPRAITDRDEARQSASDEAARAVIAALADAEASLSVLRTRAQAS